MFDPIMQQIQTLAQDAWLFLIGLLIIVAMLGALYYVLQGTTGAAFGASRMTSTAIIGAIGIVIRVLFAFLVLPRLGELIQSLAPGPPF